MKKRILSMFLVLALCLSMLPTAAFAADGGTAETWTKVTSAADLTNGEYVLAVNDAMAVGVLDGTWVTVESVTAGNTLEVPANAKYVWTLSFADGKVTLKDSNGTFIKPKGGNTNGIASGSYSWDYAFDETKGTITFTGTGDDTVTLASNAASGNKLRAYKTANVTAYPNSYPSGFSLYKNKPVRQSGIVTDLTTLRDGDSVVVFNPASKKALSTTYKGFYNNGTDVALTDGVLTYADTDVWTLGINEDGSYSFSATGGKLSMDTGYTSTPLGKVNDSWTLTVADADASTYYISNAGRSGYVLEYQSSYTTWSAYNVGTTGDAFRQQLYLVIADQGGSADPDQGGSTDPDEPDTPVSGTTYTLTDTLAAGDTVVMYNAGSGMLLSSTASGYKLSGVAASPADNAIVTEEATVAWVVGVDADGHYTFTQGDLTLGMVKSGTYVNMSTKASDGNTTWTLDNSATEHVYYVKNATMPASSYGSYYIEYYSGFTAYSSSSPSDGQYGISFYKLGGGGGTTDPDEPVTPADSIADGTYVIWNPTYKMALSNTFNSSGYQLGTAITPVGDIVTGYSNTDLWTVTNNEDKTITITQNGKAWGTNANGYLTMDVTGDNAKWNVTFREDGDVYLQNVVSTKYVEWFANFSDWSTYYFQEANADLFTLRFTPADTIYDTDSEVVKDIAQWGGGGIYDSTANATQINGDRYVVGDQKDTQAVFTVRANGKAAQPYMTTTPSTGGTNYYMGGAFIGAAEGDYMQLAVNTAGWGDMTLAFRLRATKTAPGSFQLCYSTDGGSTWKNFNTGSYAYAYTAYGIDGPYAVNGDGDITDGVAKPSMAATWYVSFAFDVPAGADNCEKLLIRLIPGTVRADGDTDKAISGNVRIDSVTLSGSPITDASVTTYVSVEPDGEDDQAVGTELTMTSETGAVIYYRVNGGNWQTYSADSKPSLESLPCDVEAYAKAEGKGVSSMLLYHYAAGTAATVKMDPNGGGVYLSEGGSQTITLTCATAGADIYYKVSKDNTLWPETWTKYTADVTDLTLDKGFGKLYVKAYAKKDGFTDSTVVTRTFTERATASYSIYFGQIHSHTNISDGAGSIEEAYSYAKNTADHVDFLAVTDHSNSFDNAGSGALAEDASKVSEEWKLAKETAAKYTDDTFVGLYGYEMTWSNGLGHMNTYNTPGFQSRTQSDYSTYSTALKNYYDTLTTVSDSISQFNHPGTTFGDFQDFSYYTEAYDELITLIEVGNGEGAIGSAGYFPSYEYYTRALDKGWHVAPTNNQDNHKGLWGNANTGRTVVLADALTEEGIYDALRNYRTYATEDNDLNIYYTLNGNTMGSMLDLDADDELTLTVKLSDKTDKTDGTVEVIVNGGLVAASKSLTGGEEETTVTFTLDNEYSYYYIRVTQADGDIAVTAPVWTGEVEAVGISSFTTDAAVAVKDQEMNLTLELYNNEKTPLELQSIVFQLGDGEDAAVIHTADLTELSQVGKLSTASYTFPYTHASVGTANIYAVVTGTLNGVEKVYKEKLELTFVPSDMVTRVIVDGTHYNDYVTGYYGGNITNLTTIAAESSIEVSVVTDKITAELLENCQLLIISAPAKKSGEANTGAYVAKPFEDDFIQLVVDYVKGGGSVVLCGLADYNEGSYAADLHTAAQINKLLKALGSTMSLNDDEVLDPENNGGQAYRLYPTNFNMGCQWCAGIVEGQQYSQYSGCSVDPGDGTWLVKGYDTTFSGDTDKDGVGNIGKSITYTIDGTTYTYNVVTDEGEVVFLAVEESGYGGNIFLSGGVFVSDFEVKAELDNIWDLPYANRTIIETILADVKVELPLSTVAEMRAGKLGDVFRIQGYVTAGTDNENTTFFDAIYVQDETGGTTVFPFSKADVAIGTPIEIIGYVDEYQGDREIQVMSYTILDTAAKVYEPEKMSNKDAMDYAKNGGKLIQVEGEVVEVILSGASSVAQFVVKDENGDLAKVFIDGYILSGTTGKNELASIVKVGDTVSAVGLLYLHPEGTSEESVAVLRVRDCDEIKLVKSAEPEDDDDDDDDDDDVKAAELPFKDVLKTDWFYDDVRFVYEKGIMNGIGTNRFDPNSTLTRGMMITMLYRMEGSPVMKADCAFTDVDTSAWYGPAVIWAAENGIVTGYDAETFGPNDPVTREQLAVILFRYAAYKGMDAVTLQERLGGFADSDEISPFAVSAMNWAVGQGLINGAGGKLLPKDQATRAQVAAIIHRYLKG